MQKEACFQQFQNDLRSNLNNFQEPCSRYQLLEMKWWFKPRRMGWISYIELLESKRPIWLNQIDHKIRMQKLQDSTLSTGQR